MSGVPLDREQMFARPAAKTFIRMQTKHLKINTRQHYEWILDQVVAAVVGPREEPPKVVPGRGAPVKPYSLAEEHAYRVMVRNQATAHRRQNGKVLLALGFGAGLVAGDIITIRGEHVVQVSDGVEIHVPGRRARVGARVRRMGGHRRLGRYSGGWWPPVPPQPARAGPR
ncbi:MAG: hypothetical protein ACR2HM_11640 [Acidimicrobiales bacterium]